MNIDMNIPVTSMSGLKKGLWYVVVGFRGLDPAASYLSYTVCAHVPHQIHPQRFLGFAPTAIQPHLEELHFLRGVDVKQLCTNYHVCVFINTAMIAAPVTPPLVPVSNL